MKVLYCRVFFILFMTSFLMINHAAAKDDIPEYFVPPPPFSEGIFPCSNCHAGLEVNTNRRELTYHENIKLKHAEDQRWCLDCHNPTDRDTLRSAGGKPIPFTESYYLCGQCHGTHFRDWKAGVHGKRTGFWNGKKEYRLCVHCHNPHQPRFKPLEPLPPPVRPEDNKYMKVTGETIPGNPLNKIPERVYTIPGGKARDNDVKEKKK